MKNNIENYKKAFGLFCSANELRRVFTSPFKQKGIYVATDGIGIIHMPVNVIDWDLKEEEKPNVQKVLPAKFHASISIDVKLLSSEMDKYSVKIEEYKIPPRECEACEGEGRLDCDLGHTHDCENCDGTGETKGRYPTGNMISDTQTAFKIWDSAIKYTLLKRLVEASNFMGIDTIYKICGGEEDRRFYFKVGDAKILIMAYLLTGDVEFYKGLPTDKFCKAE